VMACWTMMPIAPFCAHCRGRFRNAGAKAAVGPAAIGMSDPGFLCG
jgi:hypothetical protein